MNSETEIINNEDREQFEMQIDGHVARLEYSLDGDRIVYRHTEVPRELQGKGLAGKLAVYALEDAREKGRGVIPTCEFVAGYIQRHQEYADLVPEHERHRVAPRSE